VVAIVSRSLRLDLDSELFTAPARDSDLARPLVLTCRTGNESRRGATAAVADLIDCGEDDVDLRLAVAALVDRGLPRIHSEGGPTLLARLVTDGVLDELDLTLSPVLQGGDETRILSGPELPGAPRQLALRHVLAAESMLFLRYVRAA
jgi:riboflavin biosynthesis pyrimidine reductase